MQRLRQRVDRIDLKMLQLLQQRTKLSGQIGKMKRRHGAVIYVPERERELVARLTRLGKSHLSARAIAALYREILSSSRAAQGQPPIGLLQASATAILPTAHLAFGACDQFSPGKTWAELAKGLGSGDLSLALLSGNDLISTLQTDRWRSEFCSRLAIAGDLAPTPQAKPFLAERIFIVTPREQTAPRQVDRIVILIKCKSTLNAIKSLLGAMPDLPIHTEHLKRQGHAIGLALLTLDKPVDGTRATNRLLIAAQSLNIPVSILGTYPGTEEYGG
jgi:chorismate mutase